MKKLLFGILLVFLTGCASLPVEHVTDVVYEAKVNSYASSALMLKEYASLFIVSNNNVVLPKNADAGVILDIDAIGEGMFSVDSFGKAYDLDNSYVVVAYDGYEYIFYITLQSGVGNVGVIAADSNFIGYDSVVDIEEEHTFLSNIESNNILLVDQDGDGVIDDTSKQIIIESACLNVDGEIICKSLD